MSDGEDSIAGNARSRQVQPELPGGFIQVPRSLLALKITPHATLLFGALLGYNNMEESRACGYVFASNGRLAELFDVGVVAVSRWLAVLEDAQLITMKHFRKHSGTERRIIITEKGLALIQRDMSKTISGDVSERLSGDVYVCTSANGQPNKRGLRKERGSIDNPKTQTPGPPAADVRVAGVEIFGALYQEKFRKPIYPTKGVKEKLDGWLAEMGEADFTEAVRGWFRADDKWAKQARHSPAAFCSDPSRYLVKQDSEKCFAERVLDHADALRERLQENQDFLQELHEAEPVREAVDVTPGREPALIPVAAPPGPAIVLNGLTPAARVPPAPAQSAPDAPPDIAAKYPNLDAIFNAARFRGKPAVLADLRSAHAANVLAGMDEAKLTAQAATIRRLEETPL